MVKSKITKGFDAKSKKDLDIIIEKLKKASKATNDNRPALRKTKTSSLQKAS